MKRLKIILQSNLFYLGLFIFLGFFIYVKTILIQYVSAYPTDIKKIKAQITSYKMDGDKLVLYLKGKENFVATYYFSSQEEKSKVQNKIYLGENVLVYGQSNTLLNNSIPNTFNYKKYLYNKKIYFSYSVSTIQFLQNKVSFSYRIKNLIKKRIQGLENNFYMQAFILGDKSFMPYDIQDKIQDNGVSHLFALSGMHLSFFVLFLEKILKKWKFKKLVIYIFLLFYLVLTNYPVSFIRAILFYFFLHINNKYHFGLSPIKLLYLIAALLLLCNPFYLYDLGFLYSFIVTFSLLFCHSFIKNKSKIVQLFLLSIITFLFSAPITIYTNYEINLLAVLNNVLLVPFVSSIIFPLAIICFFFSSLLPLFTYLTTILEMINTFMNQISFFLIFGKISLGEVILYYLFLLFFFKTKNKKVLLFFVLYICFLYNKDQLVLDASIYFLDVGQGDSILLVSPKNKEVLLIDTGGKVSFEKESWQKKNRDFHYTDNIMMLLKSMRIRHIDYLILSHGDYDHMGESMYLINHFPVKKVLFNNNEYNELEKSLLPVLNQKKITYYKNINHITFHKSTFQILHTRLYDNENDNSTVLYLDYMHYTFLFMGDAGIDKEKDILTKYQLPTIDFLKVGHHGSDTSSSTAFINQIKPKYSIISVGKNNRYGHPKSQVLTTLKNSFIYRTDRDGSIEIKLNKKGYQIKTYTP